MHIPALLSSLPLPLTPAPTLANIQVSYFSDFDTCSNGDGKARYKTIQRDIDNGNRIQDLSGYDILSIRTTLEKESLNTCGPFFYDCGCTQLITGSEAFNCSNCVGYTGEHVYFYVD